MRSSKENNSKFGIVFVINLIYIIISVVLIMYIDVDSESYFATLFVFIFGALCQKSIVWFSSDELGITQQILFYLCVVVEVFIFIITILGLMGIVALSMYSSSHIAVQFPEIEFILVNRTDFLVVCEIC